MSFLQKILSVALLHELEENLDRNMTVFVQNVFQLNLQPIKISVFFKMNLSRKNSKYYTLD